MECVDSDQTSHELRGDLPVPSQAFKQRFNVEMLTDGNGFTEIAAMPQQTWSPPLHQIPSLIVPRKAGSPHSVVRPVLY